MASESLGTSQWKKVLWVIHLSTKLLHSWLKTYAICISPERSSACPLPKGKHNLLLLGRGSTEVSSLLQAAIHPSQTKGTVSLKKKQISLPNHMENVHLSSYEHVNMRKEKVFWIILQGTSFFLLSQITCLQSWVSLQSAALQHEPCRCYSMRNDIWKALSNLFS